MEKQSEIDPVIYRFLLKEASSEEIAYLRSWLDSKQENRNYFMQIKNLWVTYSPNIDPTQIDTDKAWEKLLDKTAPRKTNHLLLFKYWQKIAAILVFPLLGWIAYSHFVSTEGKKTETGFQEVFTPYGAYSSFTLPDNSIVWLNAGSHLKFPVQFEKGKRDVFLEGEAYFEVQSDKQNPFIVHTKELQVRATGTAFNVEAYPTDSITSVTMVKGKVNLLFDKSQELSMNPDEKIIYNNNTDRYDLMQTDAYKWCAWKDGKMIFRNDPLEYVFKRLEQTFNVEIVLQDKTIANHLYRATFEEESLDQILGLLKLTAPIDYKEFSRTRRSDNTYEKRKINVYLKK